MKRTRTSVASASASDGIDRRLRDLYGPGVRLEVATVRLPGKTVLVESYHRAPFTVRAPGRPAEGTTLCLVGSLWGEHTSHTSRYFYTRSPAVGGKWEFTDGAEPLTGFPSDDVRRVVDALAPLVWTETR